jgi:hypothetical protein
MRLSNLHLRDWFWLVAVIAVGVAWRLDHQRLREKLAWLQVKDKMMPAEAGGPLVIDERSAEWKFLE